MRQPLLSILLVFFVFNNAWSQLNWLDSSNVSFSKADLVKHYYDKENPQQSLYQLRDTLSNALQKIGELKRKHSWQGYKQRYYNNRSSIEKHWREINIYLLYTSDSLQQFSYDSLKQNIDELKRYYTSYGFWAYQQANTTQHTEQKFFVLKELGKRFSSEKFLKKDIALTDNPIDQFVYIHFLLKEYWKYYGTYYANSLERNAKLLPILHQFFDLLVTSSELPSQALKKYPIIGEEKDSLHNIHYNYSKELLRKLNILTQNLKISLDTTTYFKPYHDFMDLKIDFNQKDLIDRAMYLYQYLSRRYSPEKLDLDRIDYLYSVRNIKNTELTTKLWELLKDHQTQFKTDTNYLRKVYPKVYDLIILTKHLSREPFFTKKVDSLLANSWTDAWQNQTSQKIWEWYEQTNQWLPKTQRIKTLKRAADELEIPYRNMAQVDLASVYIDSMNYWYGQTGDSAAVNAAYYTNLVKQLCRQTFSVEELKAIPCTKDCRPYQTIITFDPETFEEIETHIMEDVYGGYTTSWINCAAQKLMGTWPSPDRKDLLFARDTTLFLPIKKGLNIKYSQEEKHQRNSRYFKLYQDLQKIHWEVQDTTALVTWAISQYQLAKKISWLQDAPQRYTNALYALKKLYDNSSKSLPIVDQLILDLLVKGEAYADNPYDNVEARWYRKEAYELAEEWKRKFPKIDLPSKTKNKLAENSAQKLFVYAEGQMLSNTEFKVLLQHQNIDTTYVWIINAQSKKVIRNQLFRTATNDFHQHKTELVFDGLAQGEYTVLFGNDRNPKKAQLQEVEILVTDVFWLTMEKRKDQLSGYLLDRKTGLPLADVDIFYNNTLYIKSETQFDTIVTFFDPETFEETIELIPKEVPVDPCPRHLKTDKNGYFEVSQGCVWGGNRLDYIKNVVCVQGKDTISKTNHVGTGYNYYLKEEFAHAGIFTDRVMYRPGQKLQFKVVRNSSYFGAEDSITVLFQKSYYTKARFKMALNTMGSASYEWSIPKDIQTGRYILNYRGTKHRIYIENYKRPTFEAKFEDVDKNYGIVDFITLKGNTKAFVGYPIANAKVAYEVTRIVYKPDYWWGTSHKSTIKKGKTKTNSEGAFSCSFQADILASHKSSYQYKYKVKATITSPDGETRTSYTSFQVSEQGKSIDIDVPDMVFRHASQQLPITILDSRGNPDTAELVAQIYKLKTTKPYKHSSRWDRPTNFLMSYKEHHKKFKDRVYDNETDIESWAIHKQVWTQEWNSQTQDYIAIKPQQLKEGAYLLKLAIKGEEGKTIQIEKRFVVADLKSKKVPANAPSWFYIDRKKAEIGDTVTFYMAAAERNAKVLLRIHADNVEKSDWIELKGKTRFQLPIKEKYAGNIHYELFLLMNNRVYEESGEIEVSHKLKKLKIEYQTFRNKLLPGEQEEWTLNIKDAYGQAMPKVEMVASLYDASLDLFQKHTFDHYRFDKIRLRAMIPLHYRHNYQLSFSSGAYGSVVDTVVTFDAETFEEIVQVVVNEVEPEISNGKKKKPTKTKATQKEENDLPTIRTNLEETVFFLPNLQSNEKGNIQIKFKMNEALTKWKLLLFAHTRGMVKYGFGEQTIITEKPIMIQPNVPRFLRVGDELVFSARVVNMTDSVSPATAELKFINAETKQPVEIIKGQAIQTIQLKPNATQTVEWKVYLPEYLTAVDYIVQVKTNSASDGEMNRIPVISNQFIQTNNIALSIPAQTEKTIRLDTLFGNTKLERVALDLTTNPAWDAIRGMRYMIEYPYECSEQLLNRVYANTLATVILNSSPQVKATFDIWRQQGVHSQGIKLDKALQRQILSESPWLTAVESEAKKLEKLLLLFDLDSMRLEQNKAMHKLKTRQKQNGGYSWYPGGNTSDYITHYVVENLGHLQQLVGGEIPMEGVSKILQGAVRYIDKEARDVYTNWQIILANTKAIKDSITITRQNVHYLYVRSLVPSVQMDSLTNSAYQFLLDNAWLGWKQKRNTYNLYTEAMLCLALHRAGKFKEAKAIVVELERIAKKDATEGMYWDYKKGWYWYQMPIETHALMIEVFHEVANDPKAVRELKTWLLHHKKDNYWSTTKATSAAVYALLIGSNWLDENTLPHLKKDGQPIELQKEDVVGGRFMRTWTNEGSSLPKKELSIKNNNKEVPFIGNVYWQYWQPIDQFNQEVDSSLMMTKVMYKVGKDSLELITENTILERGDEVEVHLHLRVSKWLEFVHLKDQHPSGCEPQQVFSKYQWKGGLGFYQSVKDISTNFFMSYLPRGQHKLSYRMYVNNSGAFQSGMPSLQCMYAPDLTVYGKSQLMKVK
ncbi:MAG: hypothetical protein GY810_15060 [Aureispira sp.]|nr:hypothetical protein [Aureispira sp.]